MQNQNDYVFLRNKNNIFVYVRHEGRQDVSWMGRNAMIVFFRGLGNI